ncbi:hypothetical protein VFPPC_07565 [Pochonia chlamydosporia 170]|uniref:Uncharacterized protein n=1 Tax=Pochonia chlamydosporia 170 TaxID=1380566 RepID=A0A179FLR4_METCM|nr:hypothetical protein VFPPC_07565 [Pochonia chlamydosporia 170]OAQ65939.1 hypothetical protein VFPPC_07565 [Pochonia chlamydosporia 170]
MAPATETQPLINATSAKKGLTIGSAAAYTLAICRPVVGATLFFPPAVLRRAFIPGEQFETTSVFLPRLVGTREVVIGSLLWRALRNFTNGDQKEVHKMLLVNLAVDVMDAVCAGAALVGGKPDERAAAGWFGAGALLFVLFGLLGIREF